jgi:hypothetical protein
MGVPQVTETFRDGGLSGGALASRKLAVLGVAPSGTVNQLRSVSGIDAARSIFTSGPLAEALAVILALAGGPQLAMRVTASTAGTVGAVASLGLGTTLTSSVTLTGSGTGTIAVTGTPDREYAIKVKIIATGTETTATFQVSLDGGVTYGPTATASTSYVLGTTGLTLAFSGSTGAFVATEVYNFTSTPTRLTGTSVMTVSGSPLDAYDVRVTITRGAAVSTGNAAMRVSLDGGDLYGNEVAIPSNGSYAIPGTGLTLAFTTSAAVTVVAAESWRFYTSAPAFTSNDLASAIDALNSSDDTWEAIVVVGAVSASVAAAVATKMSTFRTSHRFVYAFVGTRLQAVGESEADWMTSVAADFAGLADTERVVVCAGGVDYTSPLSLKRDVRSCVAFLAGRVASRKVGEDAMEVGNTNHFAALQVHGITHDANSDSTLNDARFCTLRRHIGLSGFWVTNAFTWAAANSDYHYLIVRRVLDEVARTVRPLAVRLLGAGVPVNNAGVQAPRVAGAIREQNAKSIDTRLTRAACAAVVDNGQATDATVEVDRTVVLTVQPSPDIPVNIAVTPLGYIRSIALTIGVTNPGFTS